MKKRYAVQSVVDDDAVLEVLLNQIANQGGKIVNVIWQPAPFNRDLQNDGEASAIMVPDGGFVVVSEHV